jgi:hypothetical protein
MLMNKVTKAVPIEHGSYLLTGMVIARAFVLPLQIENRE